MPALRLLLLFEKEWDGSGFAPLEAAGEVVLFHEGFDLFRFPDNARLMWFDAWRFVDRLCAKYRGRIDGVISGDEQFGALLASVIAERLGLAGNDPRAIVRAQHKLVSRGIEDKALDHPVRSTALPQALGDRRVRDPAVMAETVRALGLQFPLFVKPVKATFSVLCRQVRDAEELARHLTFDAWERLIIGQLVAPYSAIARGYEALPCHPTGMLVEEPLAGHQLNVDGYAFEGDIRILGVVDELMYPEEANGARHFLRFVYPARVSDEIAKRAEETTRRLLEALGFRDGFFNCEFFVEPDGTLRVIEVNPRLAVQFVGMYRDVAGFDIYRMLVALASGRDPASVPRLTPTAGAAASFVFRRFDGRAAPPPTREGLAWLQRHHPMAELTTYHKRGRSLAREYKWLGSHRYALLNMAAKDEATLMRVYGEASQRLGWQAR